MNIDRNIHKTVLEKELGIFSCAIYPKDILSFQAQGNDLAIWHYSILDEQCIFEYYLAFTGSEVNPGMWKHIGTTQDNRGFMWHLFSDTTKESTCKN